MDRRAFRAVALFLLLALPACSPSDGPEDGILVLAASDLTLAMPALIERYGARSDVPIELVLGASGNLSAQISSGAPADLFFSADAARVEGLVAEGRILGETVRPYALGRLALVWRAGAAPVPEVERLAEVGYGTIAIANPEHAPYGVAARQALESAGVWAAVAERVVLGENVAQAYQFVRTGNADAGLVSRSILPAGTESTPVDPALHEPIVQLAGAIGDSPSAAALDFLDFVVSAEGQEILGAHGLDHP